MSAISDLRDAWAARPPSYGRLVWAPILALGLLPWPWGEEIFVAGFVARAFLKRTRLRQALAWAAMRTKELSPNSSASRHRAMWSAPGSRAVELSVSLSSLTSPIRAF